MSISTQSQVNILIYSMGPKANDVFQSFRLSEEGGKKYKTVKDKFDDYISLKHTIHECVKFNR